MGKTYTAGETLTAADLNASLSEAVNTTGFFVFTGNHEYNSSLTLKGGFTVSTTPSDFNSISRFNNNITVTSGNITLNTGDITASSGIITDQIGNVRKVPLNAVASGYTAVALDSGKTITLTSGSMTVPASVFTAGDTITILNRSTTAAITITQGAGLTMYWAGQTAATSGNRTLGLQSICTVLFVTASIAIITGAGLS